MPTYEYQCRACGHLFEEFQKMSDAPLEDCPSCQTKDVQKLLSPAGFQLKGTGWYATDFRDKPAKVSNGNTAEKTSNTSAGETKSATTEKSTETKT